MPESARTPLTYPGGIPGHADRDTSLDAALAQLPGLQERQLRVLRYLVSIYPNGCTDDELDAHFGTSSSRTSRVRRCELARLDPHPMVVDSGERRPSFAGKSAIVWVARVRPLVTEQGQGVLL